MSILRELTTILDTLGLPVETGVFSGEAPDEYAIITPLSDTYELFGNNKPLNETQEARISLFSKGNYQRRKNQIVNRLLTGDFAITNRLYVGHEDDTGYYHYAIDAAKNYWLGEE